MDKEGSVNKTWEERSRFLESWGITYKQYLTSNHWIELRKKT